jgi:hypothetical protein
MEKAGGVGTVTAAGVELPREASRAPAALLPTSAAIAIQRLVCEPAAFAAVPGFSSAMY